MKESVFHTVAKSLIVFFATAIPSLAVLVLYFLPTLGWRIGGIMGFSFIIAMVLAVFTRAKPVEMFAIVAAWVSLFKSNNIKNKANVDQVVLLFKWCLLVVPV
jgi:hypothetical protein